MLIFLNMKPLILFIVSTICVGCCRSSIDPPPPMEAPMEALSRAQAETVASSFATTAEWPEDQWWHLFNDSQLDQLIETSLSQHPSMAAAEARVQAANAIRMRARAPLFPSIDAQGDYTRWRNSKNGIFGLAPQFPLTYTQPEATLSFNYEFDFWKKHANLIAAAVNEMEAREAEAYQSRLILAISVAEAYFELQTVVAREGVARELVKNKKALLSMRGQRKTHALDNDWDLNKAEGTSLTAVQYAKHLSQEVATSGNELQALLAGDFSIPVQVADIALGVQDPFPLPATLPLDLLAHRADIWAKQRRAEAAARRINVARANFYPNINLLGYGGLQTITPSNFFQASSFYGTIGPAFHLPIFEGGALQANYQLSQQEYLIAVAEYNEQVLTAVKEVLNALAILQKTGEIYQSAKASESVAMNSLEVARKRMQNQLNSKLDVLSYEIDWLQARDNTLQSLLACLQARLLLIRALGGGCEVCE